MKLKNKLIPLTIISGLSAIAAPIALTSCSQSDEGRVFNCMKAYIPTIKQAESQVLSRIQTNDLYRKEVIKNKQIIIDDLMWSASCFGGTFDPFFFNSSILSMEYGEIFETYVNLVNTPANVKYSYDFMSIDNIETVSKTVTLEDDTKLEMLILSFDVQYSMQLSKASLIALDNLLHTSFFSSGFECNIDGMLKFKSVPFVAWPVAHIEEETYYPHIMPYYDWMSGEYTGIKDECKGWSINLDQSMVLSNAEKATYAPKTIEIDSKYSILPDNIEGDTNETQLLRLLSYSMFASFYLGKIRIQGN